jgi:nucleoside-diphosphate-sugar epimerase
MSKKILILGVNGFIGSALTEEIVQQTEWDVYGMDMSDHKLTECIDNPRFHFVEGDITVNKEWIEYHVKKCDVVVPLVAIATPSMYVTDPLRVFELDFEANLDIVRKCVTYKKRVIFPSTSEVYGMCTDEEFDEYASSLVLGPIEKQRWIYSCSKQLLDRVIYAYGVQHNLDFTLFRPFNWLGPKLDNLFSSKEGSSRVVTQFIADILRHQTLKLVDGGQQRRSFTDISDGVSALLKIIENKDQKASGQIFNIGNPANDMSIHDLAYMIIDLMKQYGKTRDLASRVKVENVTSRDHYGQYYQDISRRVPKISHIQECLGWEPLVDVKTALKKTLDYHLERPSNELDDALNG